MCVGIARTLSVGAHKFFIQSVGVVISRQTGCLFYGQCGCGERKLRQIKYKYYSDKALLLWELCYAFFDQTRQLFVNTDKTEFLLVKNFNIVFEAIIDALIGDNPLPDGMDKQQRDGKIVDHLYTAKSLIENQGKTYYIGDSKYYKLSGDVGDTSVYKQYTYAWNVIQWNLDIFNGKNDIVLAGRQNSSRHQVHQG